jgi:hypothetical protein
MIDEEIEGVNMLFDQALDLQECGQQIPFILFEGQRPSASLGGRATCLGCVNRICQALPSVERLE